MTARGALIVVIAALGLGWMLRSPLDEIQAPSDLISTSAREWSTGGCGADRGAWQGALTGWKASWVVISGAMTDTTEEGHGLASLTIAEQLTNDVKFNPDAVFVWRPDSIIVAAITGRGGKVLASVVDDFEVTPVIYDMIGIDEVGGVGFIGSCGVGRTAALARFAIAHSFEGTGESLLRGVIANPDGSIASALRWS